MSFGDENREKETIWDPRDQGVVREKSWIIEGKQLIIDAGERISERRAHAH